MSNPTEWVGPGEPELLDPYPWHGLVYAESGTNWLQPSGGRPRLPRPVPPTINPSVMPINNAYVAALDGSLWDLGREDPPFSQYLHDVGAESMARRILPSNSGLTHKGQGTVNLFFRRGTDGIQVWKSTGPSNLDETKLGVLALSMSSVTLSDPYSRAEFTLNPMDGTLRELDRSADGRKRLLGLVTSRLNGSRTYVFFVAILTVEFTLQPDGAWTWQTEVVAGLQECIGSLAVERFVDARLSQLTIDQAGLEVVRTYSSTTAINPTPSAGAISNGQYSQSLARNGRIMSAWFRADDSIEMVRADYTFFEEHTVSLAGSYSSKWNASDEKYERKHWRLDNYRRVGLEVTLRTSLASVSLEYERTEDYDRNVDQTFLEDGPGGPGVYDVGTLTFVREERILGTPASYEETYEEGPIVQGYPVQPGIDAPSALPSGRLWAPLDIFSGQQLTLRPASTRSNKTAALVGGGLGFQTGAPWWLSAVLTPAGKAGAVVETVEGASETCIYNPITGQVARQADTPGRTLIGWQ
ncbi:hypothetical protein SAMN05216421_1116 [Halopseudomonas xinjiangensis]|uniref:Uncharacterized protein n=1 Tax=Halopseudomonas xinjiangensis TaxID=487184 RepID=A0A1H1QDY5_9GAMM|nr:hypothetical protein [Halopseudomonas xinjiangensis]SDS21660.1 hypothetical protein SAMN05216421_1116 [Halopseudomonas xinjiangensis]